MAADRVANLETGLKTDRRRIIALVEVLIAVTVWGASFVATKSTLREVSPITVVWMRFGMGVLILGAVVLARRQFALPGRRDLAYFALLGFLGITFHQWLQSTGLLTAQATTSAWILAAAPVLMALLSWLALGERLRPLGWAGIVIATLGVALVVSKGDLRALFAGQAIVLGDILMLISALTWAIFSVASRAGLQRHPAARMILFVMAAGWLFTSVQFFAGPGLSEISQLSPAGWGGVLFLGIACSGLAYIFWYDALQALPASQAGAFLYLEPLVTVVVAALVLGEAMHPAALLGGAVILLGVWLVQSRTSRPSEI